jgi:hypothetical protein
LPESDAFLSYLVARKNDRGAVGMRKFVGTEFAPAYTVIEHARHTAVAAEFFEEAGALDHALACIKFLVERQHPSGGWIDVASAADSEPDPVTTAYVLRTLLDFQTAGLLQRIRQKGLDTFVATYRKRGLHWLQENLSENGYWWLYKKSPDPMSRAYGYTVDVLSILPELTDDEQHLRDSHRSLMHNLVKVWRKTGSGLPVGVRRIQPDLDPTTEFARTCWHHRHRYPELASEIVPSFLTNLRAMLESSISNAAGWSEAITLVGELMPGLALPSGVLDEARHEAMDVWSSVECEGRATALAKIEHRPKWVQRIVSEAILPITVHPM